MKLRSAIATQGSENIAGKTLRMDAHQDRFLRINFAFDHGNVQKIIHIILVDNCSKFSGNGGGDNGFGCTVYKGFHAHAVSN